MDDGRQGNRGRSYLAVVLLTADRRLFINAAVLRTQYWFLGHERDQTFPENVISGSAGPISLMSSPDAVPSHHLLFGFVPSAKRLFTSALKRSVADAEIEPFRPGQKANPCLPPENARQKTDLPAWEGIVRSCAP